MTNHPNRAVAHTCPSCGHKFAAAKKPKKSQRAQHLWTVVEFSDGITILRGSYTEPGDYAAPSQSAIRMRAAALVNGNFRDCEQVADLVPSIARAYHVDGPEIERARNKAFAQREVGPKAWGRCLSSVESSWTHSQPTIYSAAAE